MILVFDTETSGKANFNLPPSASSQPKLVQLGLQLLDPLTLQMRAQFETLVSHDSLVIESGAFDAHGIRTEDAQAYGIPLYEAVGIFEAFRQKATVLVAHNYEFDSIIMRSSYARIDKPLESNGAISICTMRGMTTHMRLPNPGRPGFKWPKLSEAFKFCTGRDIENAHNALADVSACAEVYRWLKRHQVVSSPPIAEPIPA